MPDKNKAPANDSEPKPRVDVHLFAQAAALDPNSSTPHDFARAYARAGLAVLPLHSITANGTCSCPKRALCQDPGKHPRTKNGLNDATTDLNQIERWWRSWPDANLGGAISADFMVIDLDDEPSARTAVSEAGLEWHESFHSKTGRGRHLFFLTSRPVRSRTGFVKGLDIRGVGSYIVLPPSKHVSGVSYAFAEIEPIQSAPEWVYPAPGKKRDARTTASTSFGYEAGYRDVGLFRDACSLRARGLSREEAETLVLAKAAACTPPFDPDCARQKVASAFNYAATPRPLTDSGNAERLVAIFGSVVRYVPGLGWFVWDDHRWARDDAGRVLEMTRDVARSIQIEADAAEDDEQRDRIRRWEKHSESRARREAMLQLASVESSIVVSVAALDRDPLLLNLPNGTLDLRTLRILPHDPSRLLTKVTNASFDPTARSPTFIGLLERAVANQLTMAFLQRWFGYCLSGETSQQKMLIFCGPGANGKSTVLNAVSWVLGDYASHIDAATLTTGPVSGGKPRSDLARLKSKRFVTAAEFEPTAVVNEPLLKLMSGGDSITCRAPYEKADFQFTPAFKLVIAANERPRIRGTDDGIWRRLLLVLFPTSIPEIDQDRDLGVKLRQEAPGILNWMLEGLRNYQQEGLSVSPQVAEATAVWREATDTVGSFIKACVTPLATAATPWSDIKQAFNQYCGAGDPPLAGDRTQEERRLRSALQSRGLERRRSRSVRGWLLKLREPG
jgi:putative DNA primase/helicase